MFFFIAGVRPRVRPTGKRREGRCGRCGGDQIFEAVRLRPYFEVFFLPLIPLGQGELAWRCTRCETLRADTGDGGLRLEPHPAAAAGAEPLADILEGPGPRTPPPWPGSGGAAESPQESILGTRQTLVHRYCHHCGARIDATPREGRSPGFRRYHCQSCEREFEVGG